MRTMLHLSVLNIYIHNILGPSYQSNISVVIFNPASPNSKRGFQGDVSEQPIVVMVESLAVSAPLIEQFSDLQ